MAKTQARWSKLARIVRDARGDVTLRTRSDIERYAVAMHSQQSTWRPAIFVGSNTHETNDDITRKHGVARLLILRPPAVLRTGLPPILVRHTETRIAPDPGFRFCVVER